MTPRVVVTGLGAISPCGDDVDSTWESMVEGRSGVGYISRFDTTGWAVRIAGEVCGFDPALLLGRKKARRTDRFAQFAIVVARQAMAQSGLSAGDVDPDRLGVFVGSGIGGLEEIYKGSVAYASSGPKAISPFFIPRSLVNLAAGHVAMEFRARGPGLAVASACASGSQSIGEAWRSICRVGLLLKPVSVVSPLRSSSPEVRRRPSSPSVLPGSCPPGPSPGATTIPLGPAALSMWIATAS